MPLAFPTFTLAGATTLLALLTLPLVMAFIHALG